MKEQQLVDQLRRNGYKITPQRQEILKAFVENSNRLPQSAEEIHHKVVERYPNVSLDTIYRNLNVLEGLEIISRLSLRDGKSRYELNPGGSHQHHLICLGCGASEAIDYCPLKALRENGIAEEKRFEIKEHSFEIFGYCSLCRERPDEMGKLPGKCS